MIKRLLYCIIVVMVFVSTLSAEPSNEIKFFGSTPVTLIDWGSYKLESVLSEVKVEGIKSMAFVSEYDPEKNILSFEGLVFPEKEDELKGKIKEKKKLCVSVMNKLREKLLIDLKTGKCVFGTCLSSYFDTKSIKVPYKYFESLDKICHLSVTLKVGNDELLEYEGMLVGTEFHFH